MCLSRPQFQGRVKHCPQIHSRGALCGIGRHRKLIADTGVKYLQLNIFSKLLNIFRDPGYPRFFDIGLEYFTAYFFILLRWRQPVSCSVLSVLTYHVNDDLNL